MSTPKVEPCYRCGLPITQEYVIEPTEDGPVWACADMSSCVERIREQIKKYSSEDSEELFSYCSILARDPYFKWTYSFHVSIKTRETNSFSHQSPVTYGTELFVDGPWNIHSFESIVKDAIQFGNEYDAHFICIKNSADHILYEMR